MDVRITATSLAKSLSDVLNRVHYKGETFSIERNGKVIARLAPNGPTVGVSLRDMDSALGDLVPPGEGFADDLEILQATQSKVIPPEWPN